MSNPPIIDVCCGSKMFWFNKWNPNVLFGDIRTESHILCDGRKLDISPSINMDFKDIPYPDSSFRLVVFDPPHLLKAGDSSWLKKKYGTLNGDTWKEDLSAGFKECFRVLAPYGILIFKWNETQIKVREILALCEEEPLFGHPSGKRCNTHWFCFMKMPQVAP